MRRTLFVATLLALALPLSALANAGEWTADTRNGCTVWNDSPRANETVAWYGECPDGKADGRGLLKRYANGKWLARDEGQWRDGKMHGPGVQTYASGERYRGDMVDGARTGKGRQTWANGVRYEGDFVDGKPHGQGVIVFASGDRYVGAFRDGLPHGTGTAHLARLGVFTGTWTGGCFRRGDRWAYIAVPEEQCRAD